MISQCPQACAINTLELLTPPGNGKKPLPCRPQRPALRRRCTSVRRKRQPLSARSACAALCNLTGRNGRRLRAVSRSVSRCLGETCNCAEVGGQMGPGQRRWARRRDNRCPATSARARYAERTEGQGERVAGSSRTSGAVRPLPITVQQQWMSGVIPLPMRSSAAGGVRIRLV